MRKKTLQAIRDHGVAAYPLECCGLVLKAGRRSGTSPAATRRPAPSTS